jgi:membrane-associated phospholipid phosphatase
LQKCDSTVIDSGLLLFLGALEKLMHQIAKNIKGRLRALLRRPGTRIAPLSRRLVVTAVAVSAIVVALVAMEFDASVPGWRKTLSPAMISDFEIITRFGNSDWILYPLGIFLSCAFFINWDKLTTRHRAFWTRVQIAAGFIFVSVAGSGLIVAVVKRIVGRGRPVHFADAGIASFRPFADASWASFPSGHSTTIASFCTAIAILFPRLTIPAVIIALVVGASRVIVGAHYPSDVIAGLLFGSTFTFLMARLMVMNNFAVFDRSRYLQIVLRPRHNIVLTTDGQRSRVARSPAGETGDGKTDPATPPDEKRA